MDMTKCCPPADVLPSTSLVVHPCTPAHTSTLHHYHTINFLHSHNFALRQRLQAQPNMFSKVAAVALMGLAGMANARSLVSGLAVPVCVHHLKLLSLPHACMSPFVLVWMTLLHCTLEVVFSSIAHCHTGACAEPSLLCLHPHGRTQQRLRGVPDKVVYRLPSLLWRRPRSMHHHHLLSSCKLLWAGELH